MEEDLLKRLAKAKEEDNLNQVALDISLGDILTDLVKNYTNSSAFALSIPPVQELHPGLIIIATVNQTLGMALVKALASKATELIEEKPINEPSRDEETIRFNYGENSEES